MRNMVLGLAAACAALATPGAALAHESDHDGSGFHRGHHDRDGQFADRRDGRRHRGDAVIVSYGGEWAQYNNRSWQPDSYNDWWNDRPDRAFPRWMQNNQDCQRIWWSGGGWRC